jgi:hypothetical protein
MTDSIRKSHITLPISSQIHTLVPDTSLARLHDNGSRRHIVFRMLLLRNSQATVPPRRPPIQQRLQTRNRDGHDSSGHLEHTQNVCKNNRSAATQSYQEGCRNLQTRFSCPVPTFSVMKRIMQISAGARPSMKVK